MPKKKDKMVEIWGDAESLSLEIYQEIANDIRTPANYPKLEILTAELHKLIKKLNEIKQGKNIK